MLIPATATAANYTRKSFVQLSLGLHVTWQIQKTVQTGNVRINLIAPINFFLIVLILFENIFEDPTSFTQNLYIKQKG
jgi:ABC-type uncharacterized transport system permease subunit